MPWPSHPGHSEPILVRHADGGAGRALTLTLTLTLTIPVLTLTVKHEDFFLPNPNPRGLASLVVSVVLSPCLLLT